MIVGGVLIGGSSRRMGRDKSTLHVEGRPVIEVITAALAAHCARVCRLGRDGIPDLPGLHGPIAGILAARQEAPEAWWVIAACDMPRISAEAVHWLLNQRTPERTIVMPRTPDGEVQPTFALYGPGSEALLDGLRAPIALQGHPRASHPEVPEGLATAWLNVNTPAELKALHPIPRDP